MKPDLVYRVNNLFNVYLAKCLKVELQIRISNLAGPCNPIENQYLGAQWSTLKKACDLYELLNLQYGHMILVSGYLVLTGVD